MKNKMTNNDEIFDRLGRYQKDAKELRDVHLAIISVFFKGSSQSYLRSINEEIKFTKDACVCEYCKNRIITLNLRRNFIIEFISPNIKWNKINCNN